MSIYVKPVSVFRGISFLDVTGCRFYNSSAILNIGWAQTAKLSLQVCQLIRGCLSIKIYHYDKERMKDKHMAEIRQYFKCTIATSKIISAIAAKKDASVAYII